MADLPFPPMTSWQYTTLRFDPTRYGDEEAWARAVAADGWTTWRRSGATATIDGRRGRVWALRRPCLRPFAVHHHTRDCAARTENR